MEKPFFIIVDDEVDLLGNIRESFENEGYSDILNLKARSSGEQAVELGKTIKDQGGEVALLLTDMVMPGMKGFQVIEEYKQLFPNAVSMILTGYADKESAIRAINKGEVKGYFEKPWQDPKLEIVPQINKFLRKYFSQTNQDIVFIYRYIENDIQEFEDFFTGRYMVWQQQGWRDQNMQWLDIDEYDYYSKMLCAFEKRFNYISFAGGLRKTFPDQKSGNDDVINRIMKKKKYKFDQSDMRNHEEKVRKNVASEYRISDLIPDASPLAAILKKKGMDITGLLAWILDSSEIEVDQENGLVREYTVEERTRRCEIPAMKVHNGKGEMDAFQESILNEEPDRSFAEVGRLGLLSRYRGSYYGNRVNQRLHEEIAAEYFVSGTSDGIICCNPLHYKFFYKSMGFEPIPNVTEEKYYKINAPSMAYRLDVKNLFNSGKVNIAPSKKERISLYVEKFKKILQDQRRYVSCSCANLTNCLKKDYLEPIDAPVDYHCPLRVQRFLTVD